jgi:DNA/RNA-binding domain of Phe-tRNA-synthetase-like protein
MLAISPTDAWRAAHPGATIGLLEVSGLDNTGPAPRLDERKRWVEAALRARFQDFSRADFLALPIIAAYDRYYTRFKKTYHVQLQLESVVLKGKNLPEVSPAVDANFAAEIETLVLTAGHDAARLEAPITIDVSGTEEEMVQMAGTPRILRPGDMVMRDRGGISCSILYGQDNRSPISEKTTHALYVAYAPAGVPAESVEQQLASIEENIRLFAPDAIVEQHRLISADQP